MNIIRGSGSMVVSGSADIRSVITTGVRVAPTSGPPPPPTLFSVALDGTGYLELNASPISSGSFSIGCWFKVTSAAVEQVLWSNGGPGDIEFQLGAAGFLRANVNGSSWVTGTIGITADAWHHGIFTFDGTSHVMTLYLDGATDNTGSQSPIYTSGSCSWGIQLNSPGTSLPLSGKLADLFITSTVLTSMQAAQLAAGTLLPSALAGLLGLWRLEQGSGATAHDTSGNGNTCTLTGGATWSSDIPPVL